MSDDMIEEMMKPLDSDPNDDSDDNSDDSLVDPDYVPDRDVIELECDVNQAIVNAMRNMNKGDVSHAFIEGDNTNAFIQSEWFFCT